MSPLPAPRSTWQRAVLPVAGGALLLAAILGITWGVAAWISRGGAEPSERLAPTTFGVGNVGTLSERVAESGPLLFPDLNTSSGARTVVLHHAGDDAARDWRVYWAYPAGADPTCLVEQIAGTDRFTDCEGAELDVTALEPAAGACPIVENGERLSIGLRPEVCGGR